MGQRIIKVQVRPARAAILIDRDGDEQDLRLALRFFSGIWGGRFHQILPVDAREADDLTLFRLAKSRPDFVYGIGVVDEHWHDAVANACQARLYGKLKRNFVDNLQAYHEEEYVLVDTAIIHLFRNRNQSESERRPFHIVSADPNSRLALQCEALFGIPHQNQSPKFYDEKTSFESDSTVDLVKMATDFVKDAKTSWIDVTTHELGSRQFWSFQPPRIVLVGSRIRDLSLFWNLRAGSETRFPPWIIPVPVDDVGDPRVIDALRDWLLSFLEYGRTPNYCLVTSETVEAEVCRQFAGQLESALARTAIEVVEYESPPNRLPIVLPFEYESVWSIESSGRRLSLLPPKPRAFDNEACRTWFFDILKDTKTGRALFDMVLPESPIIPELLNGPCPPSLSSPSRIARVGDVFEAISVRCSGKNEWIDLYLPSGDEVLEEILREHQLEPRHDEKKSSYVPVIHRFGGLDLAASAFRGKSGLILNSLKSGARTLNQIKGVCKLGDGRLPGESSLECIEKLTQGQSERLRRVTRQRFARYYRNQSPQDLNLTAVLEFWAERSVLVREWAIGPCARCHKTSFVPQMNMRGRISCPACGHRITLRGNVPVAYTLDPTVNLAIKEGLAPVVLTGKFLKNMTHAGFFWKPGYKYISNGKDGDIDLIACCDGGLVFCECKTLEKGASSSNDAVSQFIKTARIAQRCGGSLAVLASQVPEYPPEMVERIRESVSGTIPYLLLDHADLERGYRKLGDSQSPRIAMLRDYIVEHFPEAPRDPNARKRHIKMGWGVFND